jgi:hypothetical protein
LCFGRRLYQHLHSSFISVDLSHGRDRKGIQGEHAKRCRNTYACAPAEEYPNENPVAKVVAHRAREEKKHGVEKAAALHNAGLVTQPDATVDEIAGRRANLEKAGAKAKAEAKGKLEELKLALAKVKAEAKKCAGPKTPAQPVGRAEEPGEEKALVYSSDMKNKPERQVPPPPKPPPPEMSSPPACGTNHPNAPPPAPPPPPAPAPVPRVVPPPHMPKVVPPPHMPIPKAHPSAPRVIPPRLSARPATVDASYTQRVHERNVEAASKAFRDAVVEHHRNGCPEHFSPFGVLLLRMMQAYEESTIWIFAQRQQTYTKDEMDAAKSSFRLAQQTKAMQQILNENMLNNH